MSTTAAQVERLAVASELRRRRGDQQGLLELAGHMTPQERVDALALLRGDTGAVLRTLSEGQLEELLTDLAGKTSPGTSRGQLRVETKSAMAAPASVATVDTGTVSGYCSTWTDIGPGGEDADGDTFRPGAWAEIVRAFDAGEITIPVVADVGVPHPDGAGSVVGTVTTLREDGVGLYFTARWASTSDAQLLRQKVLDRVVTGLSVKYGYREGDTRPVRRPGGVIGREFTRISYLEHIAIVQQGANRSARITDAKSPHAARIVTLEQEITLGQRRRDPDRARLERMGKVVAASWVPPGLAASIGVQMAYDMVMGAAEAKSRRELAGDPVRQAEQSRRDRDNAYSYAMADAMARLERDGCGVCWKCQARAGCIHVT